MALPKYVTVKRNGVEYIDGTDRAQYCINELTRAAMRDISKLIRQQFRKQFNTVFRRIKGYGANNLGSWIPTKDADGNKIQNAMLYVGYTPGKVKNSANNVTKKKAKGFYAAFQEKGTSHIHKRGILVDLVHSLMDDIRRIEAQYLSAIELPDDGESLIDESEDFGDDD